MTKKHASPAQLKAAQFEWRFLAPRYWGIWLGLGLARLLAFLPFTAKLKTGRFLGRLMHRLAPKRAQISRANLELAFPEKSPTEIEALNRAHFESLGIGLMETLIVWWGEHRKKGKGGQERRWVTFQGLEHLKEAEKTAKGILILVPHFTHIEMTGLFLSFVTDYYPIYRPHDNPLMEYLIKKGRSSTLKDGRTVIPIDNRNTRAMLKLLRQGERFIFLPDQKYTAKGHIDVPFFNHLAPSNPATSKLAKMTGCLVVPCFTRRDENGHYTLTFQPALKDFPSGDDYADTQRLHQLYEEEIRQNIPQYLWVHDRWNIKNTLKKG